MRTAIRDSIIAVLATDLDRAEKAGKTADAIRQLRDYRWVGVYDVGPELVSIIAYSGPGAPGYHNFHLPRG